MKKAINCPNNHGEMVLKKLNKTTNFRGENVTFQAEAYVCPTCQLEIATVEQTAAVQNAISDAYRKKIGLLSGAEIRKLRNGLGLTQMALAKRAGVGIASCLSKYKNR
jgi:putative zinc finger/helix-turn-helix YgiT family protein